MEEAEAITAKRLEIWNNYQLEFSSNGVLPEVLPYQDSSDNKSNAHMYYLKLPNLGARTSFIKKMNDNGINCVFHYIPLHKSPYQEALEGESLSKKNLLITDSISDTLVRLPLWCGVEDWQPEIIKAVLSFL